MAGLTPELETKVMLLKLKGYELVYGKATRSGRTSSYTYFQPFDCDEHDLDSNLMKTMTWTHHSHYEYGVLLAVHRAFKFLKIEEF